MKNKQLSLAARYSLYKDQKSKISNLFSFIGYPVLIYFLVSLFVPNMTPIFPKYSPSWYMSLGVMVLMFERQIFRGFAIYNVYGLRSLFFACLFPPIISLRVIWGNMINLVATIHAYKQSIFGNQNVAAPKAEAPGKKQPVIPATGAKKLAWAKTDHSFLDESTLMRYRRRLGDVLVEKGYLSLNQLKHALQDTDGRGRLMGTYLLDKKIIEEEQLLTALSQINAKTYVDIGSLDQYDLNQFAKTFDEKLLDELLVVPLLKTGEGFVVAFCENSSKDAKAILQEKYHIEVMMVLMSERGVRKAIFKMYHPITQKQQKTLINDLYEQRIISYDQAIIANNYKALLGVRDIEVLTAMGLIRDEIPISGVLTEVAV